MAAEWLDPAATLAACHVAAGTPDADLVERARLAAAAWVERARPDLVTTVGSDPGAVRAFAADPAVVAGAVLLTARLYARRSSPTGLASYAEFGPAAVVRLDPDVERLLGLGRYAPPRVG